MTGGTFKDIGTVDGIHADAGAVDAFCAGSTCTVSLLYDQSGEANHLPVGPKGCYEGGDGSAAEPNKESSATAESITLSGTKVYSLKMLRHEGYRNNKTSAAMPRGGASQGIYMLADGTYTGASCCWDFGNVSPSNCAQGTGSMNALFLGTGVFGKGAGNGPWFMGDFEFGVWPGGSLQPSTSNTNPKLPSMKTAKYAFGILKTQTHPQRGPEYTIRVAHPDTGILETAWDGAAPGPDPFNMGKPWEMEGAIVLGAGGDNSNWSWGTFYEGAVTNGRPSDETEALVYKNVQEAGYGK